MADNRVAYGLANNYMQRYIGMKTPLSGELKPNSKRNYES